ncbi:MAG: SBBP repeat-containing protein [Bacteroidetes bacterium]|nr:SBBP repeat-containing protein [Bacteroidota bacterium]
MKKAAIIFLFCFVSVCLFAGNKKSDKAREAKVKALAGNTPLEFIENKGQIINTEGKAANNVLFKASCGNFDIYVTDKGLSYVFVKSEGRSQKLSEAKSREQSDSGSEVERSEIPKAKRFGIGSKEEKEEENKIFSYYRLDMNLEGATIDIANIIKEEESKQGHYNYFYPHCPQGIYNVKAYSKITIRNIYKGIDWVIYCNTNNKEQPIKYDFVVHSGADYKDIKIKFVNADSLGLTDNETKLKISCIAGNIAEGKLYSFIKDNDDEIQSRYVIENDSIISFKIADYDSTKTLIIDPLVWATYYHSTYPGYLTTFNSIATDNQNNVYITGYSMTTNFPCQQLAGAYWQPNNATSSSSNIIILKFNNQNQRFWATYYGGSSGEQAKAICTDSQNNVYIFGNAGTNFPCQQLSGAWWQASNAGQIDLFILKFSNLGVRQWATYYGGNYVDEAYSICADSQDNIYLTGYTQSSNFPILQQTGSYWQSSILGGNDAFIIKFNNNGTRLWATYYGGYGTDGGASICTDSQDNLYITGCARSSDFPTQQLAGAYWQPTNNDTTTLGTIFILKFNSNGVRKWSTYYGGSGSELGSSICCDGQDNIYLTGSVFSHDFPCQQLMGAYWQAVNTSYAGLAFFILKFNNLGVRQWATYYGGTGQEEAYAICSDNQNNIFLTGYTSSFNFPIQQTAGEFYQANFAGFQDAFILKFNNQGVRQWSTFYGGIHDDRAYGIATNNQNNVYIVGRIYDSDAYTLNPGNGSFFYSGITGQRDNFILKIAPCNVHPPLSLQNNRNNICANDTGMITLSSHGGSGDTLKWYRGACGQNYIGKDSILTIASPTTTTTYYARWESLCDTSVCDSITINVFPLSNTLLNPVICQDDSFKVASHFYTVAGNYSDTLTTVNGCDSIITTYLTVNPKMQTTLNPVICQGESFQCGIHNYTVSGIYSDTLLSYKACDSIVTINLTVVAVPVVNFGKDTTLCLLQSIVLDATTQYASYLWQDMSTNPGYTVNQSGVYWVRVSIDSNCIVSDTISIGYEDCHDPRIFIPNSFTPDGDGLNDVFKVETNENFKEFEMYIYNRWGEQIFESPDKSIGWDGTYKGDKAPVGAYIYMLTATIKETNVQIKRSGSVSLVR